MAMRPFAPSALLLVALTGCGVPNPPADLTEVKTAKPVKNEAVPPTKEPVKPIGTTPLKDAKPPKPDVTEEDPAKLGLKITDTTVGTGQTAEPGDTCYMLYTGKLKSNGTVFDASEKHGNKPFSFALGAGQVIKGWDLGVKGMKVGGARTLEIPSALGYGAQGSGDSIPPNSDLVFDIKLLAVLKVEDSNTVGRETVTPGAGPAAKSGDVVTIQYKGTLIDGSEFDASKPEKPFQFKLGSGMVIPGFDLAVTGMKKGQVIDATIPPALGYGPREQEKIPSNSILKFRITLVSIG